MLSLLAGRVKGGQAAVESLTATSSGVLTTAATITSAIVSALDASGTPTSSSAKPSPATGTGTKDKAPGKTSNKISGHRGWQEGEG
jgi:hypothetical protein